MSDTNTKMSLVALEQEVRLLSEQLEQAQDLDADDQEQLQELIEAVLEARQHKVDAVFLFLKKLDSEEALAKELVELHQQRLNRVRNLRDRVKAYFLRQMDLGVLPEKLGGEFYSLRRQRNSAPSVTVSDTAAMSEWPEQFRETRIEVVANRKALAEAHKAGQSLPDGVTITQGYHLRLGNK